MILHSPRTRPSAWSVRKQGLRARWLAPLVYLEWMWEWAAFALSHWAFLEVLEYLGTFSVLIAVIFYFSESGDRVKLRHYQAWQVINTAQGKGGSGGRIEALQELDEDKVPLTGVDVGGAYLYGIRLKDANLVRANLHNVDARKGVLDSSNLADADLTGANFREGSFRKANLRGAGMQDATLDGADLTAADLSEANLENADLRGADLNGVRWENIRNVKMANLYGVKNAPSEFVTWALQHGAVQKDAATESAKLNAQ